MYMSQTARSREFTAGDGTVDHMKPFLRGRWLVGHVLVLVLAALFVRLGFWQLSRHSEKRDRRDMANARLHQPPTDLRDVEVADGVFRLVRLTGSYDAFHQVDVRNRTQSGTAGVWVLTPLRTTDGDLVVVNRGFVSNREPIAAPPAGRVTVTGILQASQRRGGLGPKDKEGGTLSELNRVDIARLDQQVPGDLYPLWVQLTAQVPPPGEVPVPLPPPELGLGPHLAYAGQWFIFALIGLIGWPLVLRRNVRRGALEGLDVVDEAREGAPVELLHGGERELIDES
jgi:surfeit locus 1 family protein